MKISENVNKHAEELFRRFPELRGISENLYHVYFILENAFFNSKTLFVCGNGGSACDGEHIVGELMKSFLIPRPFPAGMPERFRETLGEKEDLLPKLQMGLRALSLNNHPGISSAYGNDVDPMMIYAQQLFVLSHPGDVLLGISTSGNAMNVYNAFKTAKAMSVHTVLLTGLNCGRCERYADESIKVPSFETYRIQEYHLPVYHTLCMMLEEHFYGKE